MYEPWMQISWVLLDNANRSSAKFDELSGIPTPRDPVETIPHPPEHCLEPITGFVSEF